VAQLRVATSVLTGQLDAERRLFARLCNDDRFMARMRQYFSEIPQASVSDSVVTAVERADWKRRFGERLTGEGLELGALHDPVAIGIGARVHYVDRHSRDVLKAEYPSLAAAIITPDIIDDAETLATLADGRYDFVIASHVIEHMTNPIAALAAWLRVLRPGGLLYLVVPDKRATFDAHRVRTTLEHLILDYMSPSPARDFEHFVDYVVHVHRTQGVEAIHEAEALRDKQFSIHYHVFMPEDIVGVLRWVASNVTPVEIVDGPVMATDAIEFHVLARRPEA
jgi:SAM-dependent methyltransferase